MIKFNNGLYSAIIEDGNLILDSLKDVFIFEGAGTKLTEAAENEFYSLRYAGQRLNPFISDYINDNAQYYVDTHKEDAQKVHDLSKELN
jgi:hypothetical protein